MFMGVSIYSIVVGALTILVVEEVESNENLHQKLLTLEGFKKECNLDSEIYHKIKRFLIDNFEEINSKLSFDHMINEIPPTLKEELIFYQYGKLVEQLEILQDIRDNDCIWAILQKLSKAIFDKN